MTTLIALCLSGIAVMVTYLYVSIGKFNVPASISQTFYLWESWRKRSGLLFTAAMFAVTFLAIPYWISVTPDHLRFLAFLGGGALAFVGVASHFLEPDEKPVHYGAAITWAVSTIAWTLAMGMWPFLAVSVCLCLCAWVFAGRRNTLFWAELAVVMTLCLTLMSKMIEQ